MKTYVITISQNFNSKHPRCGEKTNFAVSIINKKKKHTIRGNYEYWKKRVDKINAGKAILSVRIWLGKPYCSKQMQLFQFEKLGIQKINLNISDDAGSAVIEMYIDGKVVDNNTGLNVIKNDGLEVQDFIDWFPKPLIGGCILHFTDLRY